MTHIYGSSGVVNFHFYWERRLLLKQSRTEEKEKKRDVGTMCLRAQKRFSGLLTKESLKEKKERKKERKKDAEKRQHEIFIFYIFFWKEKKTQTYVAGKREREKKLTS